MLLGMFYGYFLFFCFQLLGNFDSSQDVMFWLYIIGWIDEVGFYVVLMVNLNWLESWIIWDNWDDGGIMFIYIILKMMQFSGQWILFIVDLLYL